MKLYMKLYIRNRKYFTCFGGFIETQGWKSLRETRTNCAGTARRVSIFTHFFYFFHQMAFRKRKKD